MSKAILYDATKCIGCKQCEVACAERNKLPYDDAIAAEQQHLAELDDRARLALDPVDPDHVLRGNPILFAAGFNDCEHRSSLVFGPGARKSSGPASFSRFVVCF